MFVMRPGQLVLACPSRCYLYCTNGENVEETSCEIQSISLLTNKAHKIYRQQLLNKLINDKNKL